ncbi:DUF3140 domain-containing protein [Motilibacter aurantiacus]|uniref:DUF3140 domain-containing protein n=1 Tax=Motilibacter aurantiacus TaxID=2714955 RepID=UPI00140AEE33|nr:DUF3140 domain-containing protein [Motilibacter aurantiacus]
MADDTKDERAATVEAFEDAVNMTAKQLEEWLGTEESQSVGWAGGERKNSADGKESVGHESGRRIVEILRKPKGGLDDDDLAHMRKVTGYVHRHLAQKPAKEDVEHSRWRASLRNWGHDPLKG